MSDLNKLREALLSGDAKTVVAITKESLAGGMKPDVLLNQHMIPALDEAGRQFEANELFVPELLLIGRAMKQALEIIRPLLAGTGVKPAGLVAIGTVKGDLHDIGKNLVASMLEGGGFEVLDLGVDVGPEKFIGAVKEKGVNIVALSALLTTTMPSIKTVIDKLTEAGLRDKVKIMIGGAPVTQEFADQIGADGYSDNANGAVTIARKLAAA
jgi:5-methyltetrahydrofolate--homocysteine methyltransferase